eukprot:SAG31_NODE_5489_length_2506_cov_1.497300_1_plen_215_part_10
MVNWRFGPKLTSLKQNFVAKRPDSLDEHLERLQFHGVRRNATLRRLTRLAWPPRVPVGVSASRLVVEHANRRDGDADKSSMTFDHRQRSVFPLSPSLHLHVSVSRSASLSLCLCVSVSLCLHLSVSPSLRLSPPSLAYNYKMIIPQTILPNRPDPKCFTAAIVLQPHGATPLVHAARLQACAGRCNCLLQHPQPFHHVLATPERVHQVLHLLRRL